MSDSSSCVDVKVNDSINNSKLELDEDKKDGCDYSVDELKFSNTCAFDDDDDNNNNNTSQGSHDLDPVLVPTENPKHPILHLQEEEDDIMMKKKKYGGLLRKKPSLISKDHERAFFDSADWALRKQAGTADRAKGGSLEVLLPKLEPTPHHQLSSKRLAYASSSTNDEFNHENLSDAVKFDGDEDELIPEKI
ncbi:uncharacterized protein LOC124918877 [Impatiens glandulifera]|uniref:uncharacterized protein LOC124918877 n=1 Tax=Impatiens glandulifera TaxID=253017 RepID=UPI001FB0CEF6|nr:uncharacterized protein LOC124918877 [Impatiens glandulifera]